MMIAKRTIPRNADAAVMEKNMIAKLEELLAEAKAGAPGEGPEMAEGESMGHERAEEMGSEACCPECGQPLPSAGVDE